MKSWRMLSSRFRWVTSLASTKSWPSATLIRRNSRRCPSTKGEAISIVASPGCFIRLTASGWRSRAPRLLPMSWPFRCSRDSDASLNAWMLPSSSTSTVASGKAAVRPRMLDSWRKALPVRRRERSSARRSDSPACCSPALAKRGRRKGCRAQRAKPAKARCCRTSAVSAAAKSAQPSASKAMPATTASAAPPRPAVHSLRLCRSINPH